MTRKFAGRMYVDDLRLDDDKAIVRAALAEVGQKVYAESVAPLAWKASTRKIWDTKPC